MIRGFIVTLFTLLFTFSNSNGQLSEGGHPRMTGRLKKASVKRIIMPEVNNDVLRWKSEQQIINESLKPLVFAHTFDANISPLAEGDWFQSDDGWWIWQGHIVSEGAHSLNLIFENFQLLDKERLFLFTPDYTAISGAYTANNVAVDGIFPVAPLPGDEVIVQFETPVLNRTTAPFIIGRVNHDFTGVLNFLKIRRPLGTVAGECIPDVNCDVADQWRNVQNSVCRIMIEGRELCTGTLMNNTAENERPLVLTANHCISSKGKAGSSVFLFNYESPYCGPIDGDVSNSISGSYLKATNDSLDFSLVEISVAPPPSFRPFYAGWTRSAGTSDTVASIHHSQGDVKKISIDYDRPVVSNFTLSSGYTANGFWRINRWEFGATEEGASGGPLFNSKEQLIGNLVGGSSRCSYPFNDYYSRLSVGWDNKSDTAKQLKYWLDPLNKGITSLTGKSFYQGMDHCGAFTNLTDTDEHRLLSIGLAGSGSGGYWSGTNNQGITEVGELFSIPGDEFLHSVSLGVGRRFLKNASSTSRVRVNIYNMVQGVAEIIHTQQVLLRGLAPGAMNRIILDEPVFPSGNFLV
jgi:lysyl endopeptidase